MNKSIFFSAIFVFSANCFSMEELLRLDPSAFNTKYYSCVIKFQPHQKDGDMQTFNQLDTMMRTIIDGTKAVQKPNLFELFLNFIKEAKEAVIAGMNLFITVENHQESLSEVVQELFIEEMINETASTNGAERAVTKDSSMDMMSISDQVNASLTSANKQTLSIIICLACLDESHVAAFEAMKTKLQAFAVDLNSQNVTYLMETMSEIYEQISNMPESSISLLAE